MNIVNVLKLQSVEIQYIPTVLKSLYTCIDFSATRYEILRDDAQLEKIRDEDGYVSVQFQGIAYMIFFTMINGKKKNILISKKELQSNNSRNNIKNIKMFYMHLPFIENKYYEGSIIDGKMIKVGKTANSFIIHEFYNKNLMNMDLKEKHQLIAQDIISCFDNIHQIAFQLARLYKFGDLPDLLENKLSKSQSRVIGLMFLGKVSKSYYVYTNEIMFNTMKLTKEIPNIKVYENSMTEFKMTSTGKTDVYELYDRDDNESIGIAYIPDIRTSHYFDNVMSKESSIKVQCIKSEKFNKWIPICNDSFDFNLTVL